MPRLSDVCGELQTKLPRKLAERIKVAAAEADRSPAAEIRFRLVRDLQLYPPEKL